MLNAEDHKKSMTAEGATQTDREGEQFDEVGLEVKINDFIKQEPGYAHVIFRKINTDKN